MGKWSHHQKNETAKTFGPPLWRFKGCLSCAALEFEPLLRVRVWQFAQSWQLQRLSRYLHGGTKVSLNFWTTLLVRIESQWHDTSLPPPSTSIEKPAWWGEMANRFLETNKFVWKSLRKNNSATPFVGGSALVFKNNNSSSTMPVAGDLGLWGTDHKKNHEIPTEITEGRRATRDWHANLLVQHKFPLSE